MKKLTEVNFEDSFGVSKAVESAIWVNTENIKYMRVSSPLGGVQRTELCIGSPNWLYVKEAPETIGS